MVFRVFLECFFEGCTTELYEIPKYMTKCRIFLLNCNAFSKMFYTGMDRGKVDKLKR